MSLYDGLGITDSREEGKDPKPDVSGWSSGFKLLHSQVQAKKKALQSGTSKPRRSTNTLTPVIDLKRQRDDSEIHFNLQTGRMERVTLSSLPVVASPFIGSEPPNMITSLLGVSDEYDPLRPNDYETFVKKRKEMRQRERDEERRKSKDNRSRRHRRRSDSEEEENEENEESEFDRRKRQREEEAEEEYERPVARGGGAAIAPPPSLVEDTIPGPIPSQPDEDTYEMPGGDLSPPRIPGVNFGVSSVASKIMAKYGYKKGQGLGKKEQGMSTALFVEKTSKRGGKIIHEKDIPKTMPPPMEPPRLLPQTNAELLKNPSKVILLRNMVGPGEVDEDLEPETAEECTKYGKVIKCVIFEMPNVGDEEAVRIFVEFERIESAIKAIVDLNGRFFGGRIVKACFYNHDLFRRLELAEEMF